MLTKKFNAEKIIPLVLFLLAGEVVIVLCIGCMFGYSYTTEFGDSFVTSFIQKYNYILSSILLVIWMFNIYFKLDEKIKNKYSDSKGNLIFKIGLAIIAIEIVIIITKLTIGMNSLSMCENDLMHILTMFVCLVTIFVFELIIYTLFMIPEVLKNKSELLQNIKKYLPIILLSMFLIWTLISCIKSPKVAYDYIDDGKINVNPKEILSRAFNGGENHKDGFWSFLVYGIFFIAGTTIKNKKLKEYLIKTFAISITIISIICFGLKIYSIKLGNENKKAFIKAYNERYEKNLKDTGIDKKTGLNNLINVAYKNAELDVGMKSSKYFISIKEGIFKNSNHFGYVLGLATIITLVLAISEKKLWKNILYFISYCTNLYILIINDTFGAYLGVLVSIVCLAIYMLLDIITKKKNKILDENRKNKIIFAALGIILFLIFSIAIDKGNNTSIVSNNFNRFNKDVAVYTEYVVEKVNNTDEVKKELEKQVNSTGSGRGATWSKVGILIKQRPILGYGLECPYYQFLGQFNVDQGRTHNIVLQMLCTVGIPGALMYFTALAIILIRLLKTWKNWEILEILCVFAGIEYMVTSLTGNSTYYTSPYFVLILGLAFMINEKTVKHPKVS